MVSACFLAITFVCGEIYNQNLAQVPNLMVANMCESLESVHVMLMHLNTLSLFVKLIAWKTVLSCRYKCTRVCHRKVAYLEGVASHESILITGGPLYILTMMLSVCYVHVYKQYNQQSAMHRVIVFHYTLTEKHSISREKICFVFHLKQNLIFLFV